jgi:hypothetical protein
LNSRYDLPTYCKAEAEVITSRGSLNSIPAATGQAPGVPWLWPAEFQSPREITIMLDSDSPASGPTNVPAPTSGLAGDATSGRSGSSANAPAANSEIHAYVLALSAGLAAGLIAWAIGEALLVPETGMGSRGGRIPVSPVVYRTRNGMTALGLLGGSLGLGLGLAGGLLRGSARSAGLAGLVGALLGGAAGAGAARVLVPLYFSNYSGVSLIVPLLVHGGLWTSIAIAAGLAFGLGTGGPGRAIEAVIHAIAGALIATFTYEFAGVWLFPAAQTDRPLPLSSASRMFAYLVVALIIGAALAFGVSRRRSLNVTTIPTIS